MHKININNTFRAWEEIHSGVPQGSILGPLPINFFINDIFIFLNAADMCIDSDDNILYAWSKHFEQVQDYLKKDFEILENWFYENYMVFNLCKSEFMSFEKTSGGEIFTYHQVRLKINVTKTRHCSVLTDTNISTSTNV